MSVLPAFLGLTFASLIAGLWVVGGPTVDERLAPAWEALRAIRGREGAPVGEMFRAVASGEVDAILVARMPTWRGAAWEPSTRQVVVAEHLLGEDPRLLAAALVHELVHAEQDRQIRERPEMVTLDCIGREVAAHQDQARVWALAWPAGEMPRRTQAESHLTDLAEQELVEPGVAMERWVLAQPGYRRACAVGIPSNGADLVRALGLSLTVDSGGEVFGRIEVAETKPLWRPKCRGTGDLKRRSAIVIRSAGPRSARWGNSPAVSKVRESQGSVARFRP